MCTANVECDDGNLCTIDSCAMESGDCLNTPVGTGGDSSVPEACNGMDDNCNGAIDEDFTCPKDSEQPCSTVGDWFGGMANCDSSCSQWDESGCTNCGNKILDLDEDCDGDALGDVDCAALSSMDFGSGTLGCTSGCDYDLSGCSLCGNGTRDLGEECDESDLNGFDCTTIVGQTFTRGSLGCHSSNTGDECTFDLSMCETLDPTGEYSITPPVTYTCATGSISLNVNALTFTDTGSTLTIPFAGCPNGSALTGSSASSGTIDASCVVPGSGCEETYRLVGTYSDLDNWSGTLSMGFEGPFCFDCTDQVVPVSGTR